MRNLFLITVFLVVVLVIVGGLRSLAQRNKNQPSSPQKIINTDVSRAKLLGDQDMVIRDWSPDGKRLLGEKKDSNGVFQLYTWATDGSDQQLIPGLPEKCHKGFAHYHPSGRYLVSTVEMDFGCPKENAQPGSAANTNLWVYDFQTKQWTNLTKYPFPRKITDLNGALSPYFSNDGSKIVWSKITEAASITKKDKIFGQWEVYIADFSTSGPKLENIKKLDLGGGSLYEMHGFSADDNLILYSSDAGLEATAGLDLFTYNLLTGEIKNLTNSPDEYDEHARFSPDGTKIIWGSSSCCKKYNKSFFLQTLISESFIMNADGSNKIQITNFNNHDAPEYVNNRTGNWPTAWSPDGKQIIVSQQYYDKTPNKVWVYTLP